MDFLLCCPRGPDHQGRHAVPEAESTADGPAWAAGAEKDGKRKNRPRGCTGSAAKTSAQKKMRPETNGSERDEAQRTPIAASQQYAGHRRHQHGACNARLAGPAGEKRGETEIGSKIDLHALVLIVRIQSVPASYCALNHSRSWKILNTKTVLWGCIRGATSDCLKRYFGHS
jgi:hypothetical protein